MISLQLYGASWWNDAVVYEIFVRSYYDSDGDGIGDLKGIEKKLDYIQNMGADAIWLMPIFHAETDHCYDVVDYYQIEEDYGSMEDFESLIQAAAKRDIRIILDLVINHSSWHHDWFKKSVKKIPPYDEYYIWKDHPPGGDWFVYGKEEKVTNGGWRFNEERQQYYYAYFVPGMPDLNLENPIVREEVKKVAKFWIDKGVAGFRLDAAQNAIEEGPGQGKQYDSPSTIAWWVEFNRYVKSVNQNVMLVGEIWSEPNDLSRYYVNGKGLDLCFNFPLQRNILKSMNSGKVQNIIDVLKDMQNYGAPRSFFVPFLSNHDQDRYFTTIQKDFAKARLAVAIMMTTPGTPFLYYGEEVGMHQSEEGIGHRSVRTPMQWTAAPIKTGFTTAESPWHIIGENSNPFNLEAQQKDPASLLHLYQQLIELRKKYSELKYGKYKFFELNAHVLCYKLEYENQSSLVIINASTESQIVSHKKLVGTYENMLTDQKVEICLKFKIDPQTFYLLK